MLKRVSDIEHAARMINHVRERPQDEYVDLTETVNERALNAWIGEMRAWPSGQPARCQDCTSNYWPNGKLSWKCPRCRSQCVHPRRVHGRKVYRSGGYHPESMCLDCGVRISRPAGSGAGRFVFLDNRRANPPEPCARCGSTEGTELHHWAPRAIFGYHEADLWPTSWLCPPCHSTWHTLMARANGKSLPGAEFGEQIRSEIEVA